MTTTGMDIHRFDWERKTPNGNPQFFKGFRFRQRPNGTGTLVYRDADGWRVMEVTDWDTLNYRVGADVDASHLPAELLAEISRVQEAHEAFQARCGEALDELLAS